MSNHKSSKDNPIALCNATILTPIERIHKGTIVLEHGKIVYLGNEEPPNLPPKTHKLDLSNCIISPGLIDLHTHGAKGIDFTINNHQEWPAAFKYHTAHGTTSFLATLISAPHQQLINAIKQITEYNKAHYTDAHCLGIHLEGPYLNYQRRGIHQAENLRFPSTAEAQEYINEGNGLVKMITIAPEINVPEGFIQSLTKQRVVIAGGHSTANYKTTQKAIQAGLTYTVHTGNAMAPLHQREPGILGAVLDNEKVTCEIIADGIHLHPTTLKLIYKLKGAQGLVLATDSAPLAGLPEGKYSWQNQTMTVDNKHIINTEGKLAGSCLTMTQAVKNMLKWSGCSLEEALQMATINPARVLNINQKGELATGKDADLVVFQSDLKVKLVIVEGRVVWP